MTRGTKAREEMIDNLRYKIHDFEGMDYYFTCYKTSPKVKDFCPPLSRADAKKVVDAAKAYKAARDALEATLEAVGLGAVDL